MRRRKTTMDDAIAKGKSKFEAAIRFVAILIPVGFVLKRKYSVLSAKTLL